MLEKLDFDEIRNKLKEQRIILQQRIERNDSSSQLNDMQHLDHSDLAWKYDQQGRKKLLLARAESQLVQIDKALQRLDEGIYGKCLKCGQEINPERLQLMPAAEYCIRCKREDE